MLGKKKFKVPMAKAGGTNSEDCNSIMEGYVYA